MSTERISQILPTVTCSDCGHEVKIRHLHEHLCSNIPPVPLLPQVPLRKIPPTTKVNINPFTNKYDTPLHSPNGFSKGAYSQYRPNNASSTPSTPVTPTYYAGLAKDLQRSFQNNEEKNTYNDESYSDDFYQKSTYNNSHLYGSNSSFSTLDSPRKNSYSPAPPSPSYRNQFPPQQQQSYSTPTNINNSAVNNNSSAALDSLMADLMNSMGDDIHVNNKPKERRNKCAACGDELAYGEHFETAYNKCYHGTCFTCSLCKSPLDQRSTHQLQGKLYCKRDAEVVKKRVTNEIKCELCDQTIPSSVTPIKVLDKFYHPTHIKCYECYEPLDEKTGWKEHKGRAYCGYHARKKQRPECQLCHETIERQALSTEKLPGKWHVTCFVCQTCHKPFPDGTFYIYHQLPYCKEHYHEHNGSLCQTCHQGIEGDCCVPESGKKYHPNCFSCRACRRPLRDDYYVYNGNDYCAEDIRRLQRQDRGLVAERRRTIFKNI